MIDYLFALLVPSVAWLVGGMLSSQKVPPPRPVVAGALGFLAVPGVMRWTGRSPLEQATAWTLGLVSWGAAAIARDGEAFAAFALVGAVWSAALAVGRATAAIEPTVPLTMPSPPPEPPAAEDGENDAFCLELRCAACGAGVPVPVYAHMARCSYCATELVVAGHGDRLTVVIPDAVTSRAAVVDAVIKHLRHLRYLKLYDRRVRPLVERQDAAVEDDTGLLLNLAGRSAVDAADAAVQRDADGYAEAVAKRLVLHGWQRFLSPYWHAAGTLYQAAFGRDENDVKRMAFSVVHVETSTAASTVPLPEMGKLSYLRALRPLLGAAEAALPALSVDVDESVLDERLGWFSRRHREIPLRTIDQEVSLAPEVRALVFRPWHLADVELDGSRAPLLIDGAAASVVGSPPQLPARMEPLAELPSEVLSLRPSRCPECGAALPYAPEAIAHLCRNCFRLVSMGTDRWMTSQYLRELPRPGDWSVPFWRFPLVLRTPSGKVITDLAHLTDGIDGTLDQVGDRPQRKQELFVPAFRTRMNRAGVKLYRRLWPLLQGSPRSLASDRFSPTEQPASPVEITLPAEEARTLATVYLAMAFTRRDLARAAVRGVREGFLSARLESQPVLAYLGIPEAVIGPFRNLMGRSRAAAVAAMEGSGVAASRLRPRRR